MLRLINRLLDRPPTPPRLYEWMARHFPSLMRFDGRCLLFALAAMILVSTAAPVLVLTLASLVTAGSFSPSASMMTVAVFTTAAFWWVWKPLDGLWKWHEVGSPHLREFFQGQIHDPGSVFSLQVHWMLANKPQIARLLADALSRRHNRQLRRADVLWIQGRIEQQVDIDALQSEDMGRNSAFAQLEQWGLFAMADGHALEKSVAQAAPSPPTPMGRL